MPTASRDLHGPAQSRAVRDLFQSLFAAELINPSPKLWLFFAWISDVEILDNSARQFAALETPIDDARNALVQVDAIDSVDALASAVKALAKLSPEDLAQLREAEPFRSAFHVTEESSDAVVTTSWITWFERAVDPSFTAALDIARHGKDEWPIEFGAGDPAAVQAFVSALEKAQSDDLACERTAHAPPFLVAWL